MIVGGLILHMLWYAFWACVVFLILCGLGWQIEMNMVDKDRRQRRLQMREVAHEEANEEQES